MLRRANSGTYIALVILMLCVPAFVQGAEKGDALLETIPADALFCVRVNNLNQTTGNLDQYMMGLGPMPISTAGLIKGQLMMMFGNPELKGFNVDGSFAVFATAQSGQKMPDIYFLLPITDYSQIMDPNFAVGQPDANGISTVGMVSPAKFFISKVHSFGLLSNDYKKLSEMAGLLSGEKTALMTSLDAVQARQATTEPIWAYANMVKISSVYKKEIADGIEEMRKHAADPASGIQTRIDTLEKTRQQLAADDSNNPMIAQINAQIESLKSQKVQMQKSSVFMAGLGNAYAGYAKDFMQQSKTGTLACNPKPAVLNFKIGLDALPGTEMASTFVAEGAAKNNPLLGYTEDGAAMNVVGRINHHAFKKINEKSVDLMAAMSGKDANDPNIVKTKKLFDDYAGSIGDFIAYSFKIDPNARPVFNGTCALEVKDVNRFNNAVDEFVKTWAGGMFNDLYKNMGMEVGFTVKRGAENYKGVSIDVAKLTMKTTDTNSPQAKMVDAMYGGGIEYRWAVVNGLFVCEVSGDPNAVYKLIDEIKAGKPSQACTEMQKAMSIIPDAGSKDVVVTLNYLRMMKMMSAFAPMPFTMPDIPSRSNLVFAAKIDNGSLAVDFAMPKEHLQELMTAFQMIMQQQMQQMQKQQIPPAPVMPGGE